MCKKVIFYLVFFSLFLSFFNATAYDDFIKNFFYKTEIRSGKSGSCSLDMEKVKIKIVPFAVKNDSLSSVLLKRRSRRTYSGRKVDFKTFSTILFYSDGIRKDGKRTHPSAGAFYPVEVFVIVNNVENVERGIYKYQPEKALMIKLSCSNKTIEYLLSNAYPRRSVLLKSSFIFVYLCDFSKVKKKYMNRSLRYVFIDLGTMVENMYLVAESFSLGTVFLGAFYDDLLNSIFSKNLTNEFVCGVQPFGKIN